MQVGVVLSKELLFFILPTFSPGLILVSLQILIRLIAIQELTFLYILGNENLQKKVFLLLFFRWETIVAGLLIHLIIDKDLINGSF